MPCSHASTCSFPAAVKSYTEFFKVGAVFDDGPEQTLEQRTGCNFLTQPKESSANGNEKSELTYCGLLLALDT